MALLKGDVRGGEGLEECQGPHFQVCLFFKKATIENGGKKFLKSCLFETVLGKPC